VSEGRSMEGAAIVDEGIVDDIADVVIIGTGAAGGAAARALSEAGLDVVMIEEGGHVPNHARPADMWTAFKQSWRDAGMQVAEGRSIFPILQGCAVGGSTLINGAIIHRVPAPILDDWHKRFGLSDALDEENLERIYNTLDEELSVATGPEDVLGGNNILMRRGTEAVGITGNVMRRNVRGCEGAARCLQGCPRARKQSMDVTYVPYAIARGARLYARCRAEHFLRADDRVTGVECAVLDPRGRPLGHTLTVHARRGVFVAASAIHTPLLLAANRVGRQSKLVGRRLQSHPGSSILGVFDEPVKMWYGITQGYETTHYWAEKMKFETVGAPLEMGAARLPGYGPALMQRIADYGHVTQWGVQVRSEVHGRVFRGLSGRTVIRYGMNANDIRILKIGLKRVTEMTFAAGARAVYPGIHGLPDMITSPDEIHALDDVPNDARYFHGIASHLFGTAVMGVDPKSSVVDPRGESHELKGLYVVDSSVFPTNMGVNPAHTISAVAWRLAERFALDT